MGKDTLTVPKWGETASLYPNTSGHWYRNLSLSNARLKINSMDGLRGMAYAETKCFESSQTLFRKPSLIQSDLRRVHQQNNEILRNIEASNSSGLI